jgi:hypothetical protein
MTTLGLCRLTRSAPVAAAPWIVLGERPLRRAASAKVISASHSGAGVVVGVSVISSPRLRCGPVNKGERRGTPPPNGRNVGP